MTTVLSPAATAVSAGANHPSLHRPRATLTLRLCRPGERPRPVSLDVALRRRPEDAIWVDIPSWLPAAEVHTVLARLAPEVSRDLVEDLLERDELAKVAEGADGLRVVSAVGLQVEALPAGAQTIGEASPGFVFQMVELIVGDRLVVTCWHPSERCRSHDHTIDDAPILKEEVESVVTQCWAEGGCATAGDLATRLVLGLTTRYKHAYRAVDHWLQHWETQFHAGHPQGDSDALRRLLTLVNSCRRRLAAFNNARSHATDGRWFPGLTDLEVDKAADEALDRMLAKLKLTFENIRADMELVCMERMVAQAEAAERSNETDRKFQDQLGKVTALLLVPTLIAGIFGANTWLPGGGSEVGFDAMVALMVVASLIVYLLLVKPQSRRSA